MLLHVFMKALPFAAENEGCWRTVVSRIILNRAALVQAVDPIPFLFQFLERAAYVCDTRYGEVFESSRRRSRNDFRQGRRSQLRNNYCVCPGRVGCSHNRAEIVWVLHPIEHNQQACVLQYIANFPVLVRCAKREHALV